jgi:hypothetical protein
MTQKDLSTYPPTKDAATQTEIPTARPTLHPKALPTICHPLDPTTHSTIITDKDSLLANFHKRILLAQFIALLLHRTCCESRPHRLLGVRSTDASVDFKALYNIAEFWAFEEFLEDVVKMEFARK